MELRDFAMRRFPVEARGDASRTTVLTDLPAAGCSFMTRMATCWSTWPCCRTSPVPKLASCPMAHGRPDGRAAAQRPPDQQEPRDPVSDDRAVGRPLRRLGLR